MSTSSTAAQVATAGALVDAQAQVRAQLAASAATYARNAVASFEGWYDTAAITALTKRIVNYVEATQRQTAAVTDAYLARAATLLRGKSVNPVGSVNVATLRTGTTHAGAYGRLADQYRWQISKHEAPAQVLEDVKQRAAVMAETDTDLAFRAQAKKFMVVHQVTGYRRIVQPELSRGGSCGLCIAASTRVYHRANLLPLHGRCKCTVLPIINSVDPGRVLNKNALGQLYKAAGSTGARDLKKVRYTIHEHGELGPVLGMHGQNFTGPADIEHDLTHAA